MTAIRTELITERIQTLIDNLNRLLISKHYVILKEDSIEAEGFIFNLYMLNIIEKETYEIYHKAITKYRTIGESRGDYYYDTDSQKVIDYKED